MQLKIVFLTLLLASLAWSRPQSEGDAETNRINSIVEELPIGKFDYSFQTSNNIETWAAGRITNPDEQTAENQIQFIEGCYTYLDPDGNRHTVVYTADERGFIPQISNLTSCPQTGTGGVVFNNNPKPARVVFGVGGPSCGIFDANPTDIRQRAPWVAAIFQRQADGTFTYLCGATITSPTTVITSANCVQEIINRAASGRLDDRQHLRYESLRVIAALTGVEYSDRDRNTQEVQIAQILEHQGQGQVRQANLAGIRLKTPLSFNSYVGAVCVVEAPNSIEEKLTSVGGTPVQLAGYSREKRSLEVRRLRLLESRDCASRVTDKSKNILCGEDAEVESQTIPCDFEGYGMIVQTDRRTNDQGLFYLMGVATANSARFEQRTPYSILAQNSNRQCELSDVVFFTTYGEHIRWALSFQVCDINSLQCRNDQCRPLRELCDGQQNCDDGSDEATAVCAAQR